jgi:hypothetical protein
MSMELIAVQAFAARKGDIALARDSWRYIRPEIYMELNGICEN